MQDKTKKKNKKQIKVHDLKPVKDAKGGGGGPWGKPQSTSPTVTGQQ